MDPSIFKAYDIRGIYPDQIDEDAAWKIGYASTNSSVPFFPVTHAARPTAIVFVSAMICERTANPSPTHSLKV